MGKFKPSENASFVKIGASDHYLHKETFCAFQRMQHEAAKAKIKLTIVSATRTFEDQKTLWENKWNGKKAVNCQRRSESHLNLAV